MEHHPHEHVEDFVGELLDTGGTLTGIMENLAAALIEQDHTRDDAVAELMALALQAVMTDLERALELTRRRERDPCGASLRRRP